MPAIRINTQDKDLAEKTFHIIMRNCGFDYLPGEIYVVRERDLEWIIDKGLPIKVLSEEDVRKSVSEFKKNPLYHLVGIGKGGPPDGAENHDKCRYGKRPA